MRRLPLLAMLLILCAGAAAAQPLQKPLLPGIGSSDHRARVLEDALPWRALGRLQANAGNLHMTCTAALIAPKLLLTAAHCLYNTRTQSWLPASALHFLLGYARGQFTAHARGTALVIGTGYDPKQDRRSIGSDWALVAIDESLGTPDRLLAFATQLPEAGRDATLGGYSQDFVEVITADSSCRILGIGSDRAGQRYVRHDCAATRGASGAPLLVREGTAWRIVGITVGVHKEEVGGFAASALPARERAQNPNM